MFVHKKQCIALLRTERVSFLFVSLNKICMNPEVLNGEHLGKLIKKFWFFSNFWLTNLQNFSFPFPSLILPKLVTHFGKQD